MNKNARKSEARTRYATIYRRVSTAVSVSVTAQQAGLRRKGRRRGWTIVAEDEADDMGSASKEA